ncbi:MAG: TFIIB-type zinc ribbon-containing protein [Planctomycetota bacterium]|jgi:Zn-finger nucleic acid-binding protein
MSDDTLDCPKCAGSMEKVDAETCEIDRCRGCGGIWFDTGELTQVIASKSRAKAIDTGSADVGAQHDEMTEISCPRCKTVMEHRQHPDQPHIGYELCIDCNGSFFDAGEIRDLSTLSIIEVVKTLLGR